MEERVEETMSTCDMNVLLTESNSVALVEATAQRVDLFLVGCFPLRTVWFQGKGAVRLRR